MYGAWRMRPEDYKAEDGVIKGTMWKPPLEQSVLECLGPENCGGLNCEEDWEKCYTDKHKGKGDKGKGCY